MQSSFDATKNKIGYYKGKDCMKRICERFKRASIKNNQL